MHKQRRIALMYPIVRRNPFMVSFAKMLTVDSFPESEIRRGGKREKERLKDPKNAIREFVWKLTNWLYKRDYEASFKVLARLFLKYSCNIAKLWELKENEKIY